MQLNRRELLYGAAATAAATCFSGQLIAQVKKVAASCPFHLAVINDEISPDLDHAAHIVANEFGLQHIELRSINGKGLHNMSPDELNEAKKILATETTALLHGRAAAEQAAETARRTFEEGALAETLPTVEIASGKLEAVLSVLDAAVHVGLVSSKGEARRQIKGGGLKVNDVTVADEKMVLTPRDLTPEGVIKLSLGRKRHVLLRPV